MSLKTMIGILQVATQKRLKQNNELREIHAGTKNPLMDYYYNGYEEALQDMLLELERIEKFLQEEL